MATRNLFGETISVLVILGELLFQKIREAKDVAWQWSTFEDGQKAMREFSDADQHLILTLQALRRAAGYQGSGPSRRNPPPPKG